MLELRDYQDKISSDAAELLRRYGLCYLSMEVRTGKTFTALAAALKYGAKSVLFVSKLKALASVLKDYNEMRPDYEMDIVNYESAHKAEGVYDLIILDEAHSLGAFPRPSNRAKTLKQICRGKPVIFLSGTPSPESYSQLYHQFWVSSFPPWKLFPNFYKWAKVFVNTKQRKINGYIVNDYSDAKKDKIDSTAKHLFIDYSQEQAGFGVSIDEHILGVRMSDWTANAVKTVKKDKVFIFGEHSILGDTPVKLMSKIHQLSSGSVIDENGEHIVTDLSKVGFIRDYFRGKKIAIFYVYQSEFDLLKAGFDNWTTSPEEFQRSKDKVFIGQVRSAREGVRLDTADALIFYNLEYSYLSYEQGRNRLMSKDRTRPAQVYFLCSDVGIEHDILEAVHSKKDFTYSYFKSKCR
ncbi:MAG: hypothetical protein ACI4SO_05190 [Muribaculaceae bacterium]